MLCFSRCIHIFPSFTIILRLLPEFVPSTGMCFVVSLFFPSRGGTGPGTFVPSIPAGHRPHSSISSPFPPLLSPLSLAQEGSVSAFLLPLEPSLSSLFRGCPFILVSLYSLVFI